ncbi:TonB C-terminal domain-containing protein [Amorphus orientalis]|uniref:Outer membrane biosynthesis protein TonB n=1 Tax=Amorphus orientalis TaxID=649198 RepID=A0AAE4ARF4_9HYPH|nr:TonB C-terminal domain-containing protein [Amorphus orientalis]MDQ0313963.1 outer membrane biosynthesis protein TonB [Amorphus orientalis]
MRVGLIVSLAAHGAILLWSVVAWPDAESFAARPIEALPVELVTIGEVTDISRGSPTAEVEPEPEPDRETVESEAEADQAGETETPSDSPAERENPSEAESAAPEPAAEPEAPDTEAAEAEAEAEPEPVPAPEQQAEAQAEPEPAPEQEQETEPQPTPTTNVVPRSKPNPPPQRSQPNQATASRSQESFDADRISSLLNKVEPSGGGTGQSQASAGIRSGGTDARMTMTELDALRSQIQQCWNPPIGARGADDLLVRVEMRLNPDGSVVGSPEVLNSSANPFFQAAADSARRAVLRCQPYNLPAEKYETWRQVRVTFDPRDLF